MRASLPEMLFMQQCATELEELPEREFMFAKPRRFRFDFAWPAPHGKSGGIAVEIDGGIYSRGRHARGQGIEGDMRKLNLAASLGWIVFRFSPDMVNKGEAIAEMKAILGKRRSA